MKRTGRSIPLAILLAATVPAHADEKRAPEVVKTVDGHPLMRLLEPDAIPAINRPDMITAAEADRFLKEGEPVLGVFDGQRARAYPTWVLDRHEIVNDRLGGVPIAATW